MMTLLVAYDSFDRLRRNARSSAVPHAKLRAKGEGINEGILSKHHCR